MHGLCSRALHCCLRDRYGDALWRDVATKAGLPEAVRAEGFDALRSYDDALGAALLEAAAAVTGHEAEALLEDLGTYLVSHPSCAALRRLLRFTGPDFIGFLHGLEELPHRVRLAVDDLHLPDIRVQAERGCWRITVGSGLDGFAAVLTGTIRAMADDYGTLALLMREGGAIEARLVEADFAEGRGFALAG